MTQAESYANEFVTFAKFQAELFFAAATAEKQKYEYDLELSLLTSYIRQNSGVLASNEQIKMVDQSLVNDKFNGSINNLMKQIIDGKTSEVIFNDLCIKGCKIENDQAIRTIFQIPDENQVLGKGSYGKVYYLQILDSNGQVKPNYALKISLKKNDVTVLHEAVTSLLGLNQLRSIIPNFVYVYKYLNCSIPETVDWCAAGKSDFPQLIMENISSDATINGKAIEFFDFFQQCSNVELLDCLMQMCLAFELAYEKFKFVHNDFHMSNSLIVPMKQKHVFKFPLSANCDACLTNKFGQQVELGSNYLYKIIDYGFSESTIQMANGGRVILSERQINGQEIGSPYCDQYKVSVDMGRVLAQTYSNPELITDYTSKLDIVKTIFNSLANFPPTFTDYDYLKLFIRLDQPEGGYGYLAGLNEYGQRTFDTTWSKLAAILYTKYSVIYDRFVGQQVNVNLPTYDCSMFECRA